MKLRTHLIKVIFGLAALLVVSCSRNLETGKDLSNSDIDFIRSLGVLDKNESIILFDSQGGVFYGLKTSGNFFTDKRIASYWIDDRDTSKTNIEYAFYKDVDTIWRYPKYRSLTLASYLEVHKKDGTRFKVYVSADSATTWQFFNRALGEWNRKTNTNQASKP